MMDHSVHPPVAESFVLHREADYSVCIDVTPCGLRTSHFALIVDPKTMGLKQSVFSSE